MNECPTGYWIPDDCLECEFRPAVKGEDFCQKCLDHHAEIAYERQQEEGFRGGEAEAFLQETQAWIQRNLK